MAIKSYKPTTPSRRQMTVTDYSCLSKVDPEKSLLAPLKKTAGRNSYGRITVRHRGGGSRRKYRIIDFKRDKQGMNATVLTLEYDPNRSAFIALVQYHRSQRSGCWRHRYKRFPCGHQARQCAGALRYPSRYFHSQHRALSRQGRAACAFRRKYGSANG